MEILHNGKRTIVNGSASKLVATLVLSILSINSHAPITAKSLPVDQSKPSGKVKAGKTTIEWQAIPPSVSAEVDEAEKLLKEGKPKESQEILLKALALQEKVLGKNSPELIVVLSGLGTVYWSQGDHTKAQESLLRSLKLQHAADHADKHQTAYDLRVLGQTYLAQGDLTNAQSSFALALHTIDSSKAKDSKPERLQEELVDLLAQTFEKQSDWHRAEPLLNRLNNMHTKYGGELNIADSSRVAVLKRLGRTAFFGHEHGAAAKYFGEAAALQTKLQEKPQDLAATLSELASTLASAGKFTEAENTYNQVLSLQRPVLTEDSKEVQHTLAQLAYCSLEQKKFDHAATFLEKLLAIQSAHYGATADIDAVESLTDLADAYAANGKPNAAITMYERVLQLRSMDKWKAPQKEQSAREKLTALKAKMRGAN